MSDDNTQDKTELISSIRSEAEAEAKRIIQEAEHEIEQRRRSVESQIERVRREEAERADDQIAAIEHRKEIAERAEHRRRSLALRKQLIEAVEARVEQEILDRRESDEYRRAIAHGIVEGIVGLDAERVVVETTPAERALVESVVPDVEALAREVMGRSVAVDHVEGERVGSAGVIVRDCDAERAFDNTVATRIYRNRGEMHRLIAERLFNS